MNQDAIKRKIKAYRWYRQGGAAKPLYVSYPFDACYNLTLNYKKLPINYNGLMWYFKDNYFYVYLPVKVMKRAANFYYSRQQEESRFIYSLRKKWQKEFSFFIRNVHRLTRLNFQKISTPKLIESFIDFSLHYEKLWREAIFHDAFDVSGYWLLKKILKKEKISLKDNDLHILTSVTRLSWLQKERRSLLFLVDDVKRNKDLKKAVHNRLGIKKIKAKFPNFYKKLTDHSAKFHWLSNDLAEVKRLDEKYFLGCIRNLILDKNLYIAERKSVALPQRLKRKQNNLYKKLNLPRATMNLFSLLTETGAWRDSRKSMNQMGSALVHRFAKEFAARLDAELIDLEYLFWRELSYLFTKEKNKYINLSKKRQTGMFCYSEQDAVYGAKARKLYRFIDAIIKSSIKNLVGQPAYKGIVKGRAKILLSQKDFKKMKKGDILITANTRPEYLPVMKIASAIVTEEGGITSHAAIVSRELGIPCVVGTKIATDILKDGDIVEVDANYGVVNIIEKSWRS